MPLPWPFGQADLKSFASPLPPTLLRFSVRERSRPGRGTSSQAPGQACHQRGVAPGESCDASGARDLSGEEGFRRAVRHSGSLTSLSSSPRRAHVVQSHVVTVKEGMEARTEYGLELNSFPVRLVQITHLSYQGVFRLRCRQGTDRQTGESPLKTCKRPESVCGEIAGPKTESLFGHRVSLNATCRGHFGQAG